METKKVERFTVIDGGNGGAWRSGRAVQSDVSGVALGGDYVLLLTRDRPLRVAAPFTPRAGV